MPRSASSDSTARANVSAAAARAFVSLAAQARVRWDAASAARRQPFELGLGSLQPLERRAGVGRHRQHPVERRGVAALELGERLEPRLDVLEPAGVGLDALDVAAQLDGRILKPGRGVAQLGRGRGQPLLVFAGRCDDLGRPRRQRLRALALGRAQQVGGCRGRRDQVVEVAQAHALGAQRVGLARLDGGGIGPLDEILQVEPVAG